MSLPQLMGQGMHKECRIVLTRIDAYKVVGNRVEDSTDSAVVPKLVIRKSNVLHNASGRGYPGNHISSKNLTGKIKTVQSPSNIRKIKASPASPLKHGKKEQVLTAANMTRCSISLVRNAETTETAESAKKKSICDEPIASASKASENCISSPKAPEKCTSIENSKKDELPSFCITKFRIPKRGIIELNRRREDFDDDDDDILDLGIGDDDIFDDTIEPPPKAAKIGFGGNEVSPQPLARKPIDGSVAVNGTCKKSSSFKNDNCQELKVQRMEMSSKPIDGGSAKNRKKFEAKDRVQAPVTLKKKETGSKENKLRIESSRPPFIGRPTATEQHEAHVRPQVKYNNLDLFGEATDDDEADYEGAVANRKQKQPITSVSKISTVSKGQPIQVTNDFRDMPEFDQLLVDRKSSTINGDSSNKAIRCPTKFVPDVNICRTVDLQKNTTNAKIIHNRTPQAEANESPAIDDIQKNDDFSDTGEIHRRKSARVLFDIPVPDRDYIDPKELFQRRPIQSAASSESTSVQSKTCASKNSSNSENAKIIIIDQQIIAPAILKSPINGKTITHKRDTNASSQRFDAKLLNQRLAKMAENFRETAQKKLLSVSNAIQTARNAVICKKPTSRNVALHPEDPLANPGYVRNITSPSIHLLFPKVCYRYMSEKCPDKDSTCTLLHFLPDLELTRVRLEVLGPKFAVQCYNTYVIRCGRLFVKYFSVFCKYFGVNGLTDELTKMISECSDRKLYYNMWLIMDSFLMAEMKFSDALQLIMDNVDTQSAESKLIVLRMILDDRNEKAMYFLREIDLLIVQLEYEVNFEVFTKLESIHESSNDDTLSDLLDKIRSKQM